MHVARMMELVSAKDRPTLKLKLRHLGLIHENCGSNKERRESIIGAGV